MRKILFRGKREDNGEWIEGGFYTIDKKAFIVVVSQYIPDTRDWAAIEYYENNPTYIPNYICVIPETVGQFTGLCDKNGNKIFEGDIMHNAGNVVEFCSDGFCINGDSPLVFWTKTEIIGNIYDNKVEVEV